MFICIYKKADSVVHQIRNDTSVPQVTPAEQHLLNFCSDNGFQPSDYAVVEMPVQNVDFRVGKFVYDAQTNSMAISPNWIEPPAAETSSIPVSDPGAPA